MRTKSKQIQNSKCSFWILMYLHSIEEVQLTVTYRRIVDQKWKYYSKLFPIWMWSFLLFLPSSWWLVAGEARDHQDPDPRMMLVTLLVAWVHLRFRISQTCKWCLWMLTMFNNVNGSKLLLCSENINVHTSNIQCIFSWILQLCQTLLTCLEYLYRFWCLLLATLRGVA